MNQNTLRLLFEHSPDAVWLLDAERYVFVDCNAAAVAMMGARDKTELLLQTPQDFSPQLQPDGRPSKERAEELFREVQTKGCAQFEWLARRMDGTPIDLEVVSTRVHREGRDLHFVVARDITNRKQTETQIQEMNCLLEMRVRERTLELVQTNEQLKEEIRQRRRKEKIQHAIYQISEAVLKANDLDTLYRSIHETVRALMPATNFYIALREPGTDVFHFPYFVDEVDPPPEPLKVTTGLTGYVLKTGQALLVNRHTKIQKTGLGIAVLTELGDDAAYVEHGSPTAVWLGAPLTVQSETIGVVAVQDYRNEQAYGEEEKQILSFVAKQTAAAIERKQAEQALRESEAKHRALFEASSQGVMLHDDRCFLEVNPAAIRILGYNSAQEIVGHHPAATSAPIQPSGETAEVLAQKHIHDCMTRGSTRFEWVARNPKGVDVPIEVFLTRIPMGGRYIIQAVINDISERKRAESELLKALVREKELSQLKSNFVSTVSHEFRTPLGVIMTSSQILADYFDELTPEERQEHLESITVNTRRMASLMEEVLLLSRVDSGKMVFAPADFDLQELLHRLIEEVSASTQQRCPIQLRVGAGCGRARADERLLRHIFTNLLSNAVKYSPAGCSVEFTAERAGCDVVCQIRDQGIGIVEEDRPWLFNAFQRGRNVGDRPGTGLGLTIVKRCLELHRGEISLESAFGQGTTACVRIPVFPSEDPGSAPLLDNHSNPS